MKKWLALVVVSMLAGCAAQPAPIEKVITVEKRVKEPCIDKAPVRPVYQYGKGEWQGGKSAAMQLADDFEKAEQYGIAWEAAAAGCIKPE